MFKSFLRSPIGLMEIKANDKGITSVSFQDDDKFKLDTIENYHTKICKEELNSYFEGNLKFFKTEMDFNGTNFQIEVWKELLEINFGDRISYNDVSVKLGDPKKVRAVANANGQNPIAILVPCHRVIGSDGSLTGYAGGLWRKKWLLQHEAKYSDKDFQTDFFE